MPLQMHCFIQLYEYLARGQWFFAITSGLFFLDVSDFIKRYERDILPSLQPNENV